MKTSNMWLCGLDPFIRNTTRMVVTALVCLIFGLYGQTTAPHMQVDNSVQVPPRRPLLINKQDTALCLAPNGSLWAWGGNEIGLMGVFPKPTLSEIPEQIGSDSDWEQVDTDGTSTLALKRDGTLWGWGWNYFGELGWPELTNHTGIPKRIGKENNWSQISVEGSSLGLKNDGSMWAWGLNCCGQLGDGTTNNRSSPVQIGLDRDWKKIKAIFRTSFGLKTDGTLLAWGDIYGSYNKGQLTPAVMMPGTTWLDFSSCFCLSVGKPNFTLVALKSDGSIWLNSINVPFAVSESIPDRSQLLTQIGQAKDWDRVFAGENSIFARKKNGSWYVCGQNWAGQLGLGISTHSVGTFQRLPFSIEPLALVDGSGTTLILDRDGRLWSWGNRLGTIQNASDNRYTIDKEPHLVWKFLVQAQ